MQTEKVCLRSETLSIIVAFGFLLRFLRLSLLRNLSLARSLLLPSQILSIKTSFREKIAHLKSAKKLASFLIDENASLATAYPDVCTAYMMYMIIRVTVAKTERPFSKLKLIKNFLESFMS